MIYQCSAGILKEYWSAPIERCLHSGEWAHIMRRHQMKTFSALLALCAGNSPVTGEFPSQRPVTRSFDVFSDLCLNRRLSKYSWGWWFESSSRPLWRHCMINDPFNKSMVLNNPVDTTQLPHNNPHSWLTHSDAGILVWKILSIVFIF